MTRSERSRITHDNQAALYACVAIKYTFLSLFENYFLLTIHIKYLTITLLGMYWLNAYGLSLL